MQATRRIKLDLTFHRYISLLRLLTLSALLAPCVLRAQSPTVSGTSARPAILGTLENCKYSNPVIGFELQLNPACTYDDEARAVSWSTQLPQRLSLPLRCGKNLVLLSSFPLHADEKIDLNRDAQASLQGVLDGGGFKMRGRWRKQTAGGIEVLVQELFRRSESGQELGFYNAFMIGRRYVSLLAVGPETNKEELRQAVATLRIAPKPQ
jgi:hypothetical protein